MALKVTVYGGTNNQKYNKKEIECAQRFGSFLASIGAEILTGACYGFPYYIGKASVAQGGKVVGYSPAVNEKEHTEKYKFPLDGVSHMEYIDPREVTGLFMANELLDETKNKSKSFIRRSYEMTPFSDIVVAFGGSWGTYTELLFSFWSKKTIILISEFGGAAEAFLNTWNFFDVRDNNPVVHQGATIVCVANVDEAIDAIEKLRLV